MLSYAFMQRALVIGFLLGLVIPMMGVVVVNRRTSTIGDALAHSSLAGIGLGLVLGITPMYGAIFLTLAGAFTIEGLRRKFPKNGDLATAMVLSTGVGLASLFTDWVPMGANMESYLFGSIVSSSDQDVIIVAVLSLVISLSFLLFYGPLAYLSLDPVGARISGLPADRIDSFFTLLLALTISIASKTIGVLMVSSLLILPVATAMVTCQSYGSAVRRSIFLGVFFVLSGLSASYYLSMKPGGAIVLVGVFVFLISLMTKAIRIKGKQYRKI